MRAGISGPFSFQILGAFAKLREATIMSVCPSIRQSVPMEQLGAYWTDFHEI